jgi:hypothetical protein
MEYAMKTLITIAVLTGVLLSASAHSFGQVPAAPAAAVVPPATPTLWSFLGVPQGVKKVQGALTNRRGNHPATEPKNAMKALNDPANLLSENKAIKKAAQVKLEEDLKPQKIKALKYLTSIGCGCYDKGGEVTAALIASAEDCTEDVRLATMQAIHGAALNKCCNNCGQVCCCNEKLLKKLAVVAYERDDHGCYTEPSKRVRDAAIQALKACCPNGEPPCIGPEPEKSADEPQKPDDKATPPAKMGTEGGTQEPEKMGTEGKGKSKESVELEDAIEELKNVPRDKTSSTNEPGHRRVQVSLDDLTQPSDELAANGSDAEFELHSNVPANPNPNGGVVISYNTKTQVAHVHFTQRDIDLAVGDEVYAKPGSTSSLGFRGRWEVIASHQGCVKLRPLELDDVASLRPGDHVFAGSPPVTVVPASFTR